MTEIGPTRIADMLEFSVLHFTKGAGRPDEKAFPCGIPDHPEYRSHLIIKEQVVSSNTTGWGFLL